MSEDDEVARNPAAAAAAARDQLLDTKGQKDWLIGVRSRDNRGRRRKPAAASVEMPCGRCGTLVYVDAMFRRQWPKAKAVCVTCTTGAPDEEQGLQRMRRWLGIGDPRGAG